MRTAARRASSRGQWRGLAAWVGRCTYNHRLLWCQLFCFRLSLFCCFLALKICLRGSRHDVAEARNSELAKSGRRTTRQKTMLGPFEKYSDKGIEDQKRRVETASWKMQKTVGNSSLRPPRSQTCARSKAATTRLKLQNNVERRGSMSPSVAWTFKGELSSFGRGHIVQGRQQGETARVDHRHHHLRTVVANPVAGLGLMGLNEEVEVRLGKPNGPPRGLGGLRRDRGLAPGALLPVLM